MTKVRRSKARWMGPLPRILDRSADEVLAGEVDHFRVAIASATAAASSVRVKGLRSSVTLNSWNRGSSKEMPVPVTTMTGSLGCLATRAVMRPQPETPGITRSVIGRGFPGSDDGLVCVARGDDLVPELVETVPQHLPHIRRVLDYQHARPSLHHSL
jgi:hypothetical protein